MNKNPDSDIKAIIFDVGGVLVRTADQSGRQKWESQLGLPPGGAEALVLNSEMGHRAQRGEISTEALWAWVLAHLELNEGLPQFRQDFWGGDVVDQSLVTLIRKLRRRYQLAIISNAMDSLTEMLAEYTLLDEFDLIIGSAYEGVMKPDPIIFKRTLQRLGVTPPESIFIDDSPINIAGAQALGINTILFTPTTNLADELAEFNVEIL